jgi:transglutaminase-like putative cysteine protease
MSSARSARLLLVTLVCLARTTPAATPGDVLRTLPTPGSCPTGLAFDGARLWLADRLTDTLVAVDPGDGRVLASLPAPGFIPLGLAWDGHALWVLDGEEKRVYQVDPATGLTLRSIEAPSPSPQAVAWDGSHLWLADDKDDRIYQISTDDGTTVTSIPSPAGSPTGLTFDGAYLWCSDRVEDRIYMLEPGKGTVVVTLDAPGKYARGLAWANGVLWNVDYQDDRLYALDVGREGAQLRTKDVKRERMVLTHELRNYGPGEVKTADVYFAVPSDRPNQRLLGEVRFDPAPTAFLADRWGQKLAHYTQVDVPLATRVQRTMTVEVELASVRWFLFPEKVGRLEEIPGEIRDRYLVDEDKYRLDDPVIRAAVAEAVGDERNPYWIMRRIHSWVGEHLEYELAGGWNVAPAVIERGTGSCSEYTFVFIAMCRAAGLPARYVGAVMVRGDDASTDDVFHRWPEVYLPGYGWIPADAQAGDKKRPADVADSIGHLDNRALITTVGGGASAELGWGYNTNERWTAKGAVKVHVESVGEWSPGGSGTGTGTGTGR